jgi:hypothetical protein
LEKQVKLDDVILTAEGMAIEEVESRPTGNRLRRFEFLAVMRGISMQKRVAEILTKEAFSFEVPSDSIAIRAAKKNAKWSYSGDNLDEESMIEFHIDILELDKDLPEGWNMFGGMLEGITMNWIRTRALADLLAEKGIISRAEYEEHIHGIVDKDFEKLRRYLMYGLPVDYQKKKQK